jgi:N-acetylglucosamine kinase-like BadF-type ATPase
VRSPAVLAVDGGASKVDAALVGERGELLSAVRVRNRDGSHGPEYLEGIAAAVESVCVRGGLDAGARPLARLGVFCLAGADFPADDRRLRTWLAGHGWAGEDLLRNDTFAVLRAGTKRHWGVAVVCGSGMNCSGVAPDGRVFRFPAIGRASGDWGGGEDLGADALWFSVRAEDGRGERTVLSLLVAEHFEMRRARQVAEAIHLRRLSEDRLLELAPLVFGAAASGDPVARSLVDRQAGEVVAMAGTAIRRLRMRKLDVDVVLGGGIFRNAFPPFFEMIRDGLRAVAPASRIAVMDAPPLVGAVLLALDVLGAGQAAERRLRSALTHDRLAAGTREPARRT